MSAAMSTGNHDTTIDSHAANDGRDKDPTKRLVIMFGACGLDRLLTVDAYPFPESKVRTTNYIEVGGGNAANVAHATSALQQTTRVVALGTKIGSDAAGQSVVAELRQAGVVLDHAGLFQVVPDTTTAFTTIIVSTSEHTRTCIHTPGTCGEWTEEEMRQTKQEATTNLWNKVCHFHSDARHTTAALYLAKQAKQRGIPISLDVEKDRSSAALDELLGLADIVFTNELQLDKYLRRLTLQWEAEEQILQPLKSPRICNQSKLSASMAECFVKALEPSTYFVRRYQQVGKQVVITKGHQGSIHVECESIQITATNDGSDVVEHIVTLQDVEGDCENGNTTYRLKQLFEEQRPSATRRVKAIYKVSAVGISRNITIIDTTGAGDAFLGGYLAAKFDPQAYPTVMDCLRLATWVAGHKIQGPGARTTLPTALQRDKELGTKHPASTLRKLITAFGETSC